MVRGLLSVVLSIFFLVPPGLARADQASAGDVTSPADARARDLLQRKLDTFGGAERGQVISLVEDVLARVFSGDVFYALRFRQYPVALVPPGPLGTTNLFIVRPDGSVGHLADVRALEAFFRAALRPVTTDEQATQTSRRPPSSRPRASRRAQAR